MTAPELWWSEREGDVFAASTTDDHGFSRLRRYSWQPELPADAARLATLPVAALLGIASQLDGIAMWQDRPGAMAEIERLAESVRALLGVPAPTKENRDD